MLAYYEEREYSSEDKNTYQQPENQLEDRCDKTRSKLDDQARKRDSSNRTQNTRRIGSAETLKIRLEWPMALMITIIGFVMMSVATTPLPQESLRPTNNKV